MNPETITLFGLGDYDEELQKKIVADIERIIAAWVVRNMSEIAAAVLTQESYNLERLAVRALKNHLNNTVHH